MLVVILRISGYYAHIFLLLTIEPCIVTSLPSGLIRHLVICLYLEYFPLRVSFLQHSLRHYPRKPVVCIQNSSSVGDHSSHYVSLYVPCLSRHTLGVRYGVGRLQIVYYPKSRTALPYPKPSDLLFCTESHTDKAMVYRLEITNLPIALSFLTTKIVQYQRIPVKFCLDVGKEFICPVLAIGHKTHKHILASHPQPYWYKDITPYRFSQTSPPLGKALE